MSGHSRGHLCGVSYSAEQRTREVGIRLTLGAAPRSIMRLVLGVGLWLAGAGIAGGLLAAIVLTRYLATWRWCCGRNEA